MQQAMPQQLPSSVPQQQEVREGFASAAVFGSQDCAEAGVQIGATLVLMASNATATARNGFGVRYIGS